MLSTLAILKQNSIVLCVLIFIIFFHCIPQRPGGAKRKRDGDGNGEPTGKRSTQQGERQERRERRFAGEQFLRTRPHDRPKKGELMEGEEPVRLVTNYFKLERTPTWNLYMYSVQCEPNVESLGMRRALLRQHHERLGGFIFNGTSVLLSQHLGDVVCLNSRSREEEDYHVKLKFTKVLSLESQEALTILNLIQRSAIRNLNLVLVGRNYHDQAAEVSHFFC